MNIEGKNNVSTTRRPGKRSSTDLICFWHLRWDFVFQRPQHLMSRAARKRRVFVIEEPVYTEGPEHFEVSERQSNLFVVVPPLRAGRDPASSNVILQDLLDDLLIKE